MPKLLLNSVQLKLETLHCVDKYAGNQTGCVRTDNLLKYLIPTNPCFLVGKHVWYFLSRCAFDHVGSTLICRLTQLIQF